MSGASAPMSSVRSPAASTFKCRLDISPTPFARWSEALDTEIGRLAPPVGRDRKPTSGVCFPPRRWLARKPTPEVGFLLLPRPVGLLDQDPQPVVFEAV